MYVRDPKLLADWLGACTRLNLVTSKGSWPGRPTLMIKLLGYSTCIKGFGLHPKCKPTPVR
eukprot:306569-Pelagomonas_calceolata.AAC.6